MSKKLYSTTSWRLRTERIKKDRDKRRRRKARRAAPGAHRPRRRVQKTLVAPSNFSIIHNPCEVVRFLNTIESQINSHNLLIDFAEVTQITAEAVLALIATMKKHSSRSVRGTIPALPEAWEILRESGFFDHVHHGLQVHGSQGKIGRFEGTKVDPVQARELIMQGTSNLVGTRMDDEPAYCVILEAMQNTVDHAHARPGRGLKEEFALKTETWWAMVYSDQKRKRVCFALLDTGVGIFRSAKIRAWRRADRAIRRSADISILKQMLRGGIESRTGQDYRGKGLPRMYQYSEAGEICDFLIMSNSVHAKVGSSEFISMDDHFTGTLLYWEITK